MSSNDLDSCTPETTANECANAWCDDRLADLPKRQRVRLIAKEPGGQCFVEFPTGAKGFVVADGDGFTVTQAPCVEIPVANTYATDPATGAVLYDDCGVPIRAANPGWENIIITDENGCQNRLGGLDGIPADLHWDGTKFILKPTEELEGSIPLSNYEIFEGTCDTYNAVFRTEEVCSPTEGLTTVAKLGYQLLPVIPCGMIVPFGGADSVIPSGWLKCDGSAFAATEYPCLYSAIGIGYGGAGANFNVPDMQGRAPVGIRPAADGVDAIGLGDLVALNSGASSLGKSFEPDWESLAVDPVFGMSTLPINGSIAATMSNLPSGTTSFDFNFNVTVPAGATHVVLAAWVRTACLTLGHSCRNLVQIGLTPGAAASAGRYITESVSGVVEDEVGANGPIADDLGSRYDFQVKSDGSSFDVETIVNFNARVYSNGTIAMTKYYAYEVFQHGFRFGEEAGDTQLIGTNYIIYAGAATSCTNA